MMISTSQENFHFSHGWRLLRPLPLQVIIMFPIRSLFLYPSFSQSLTLSIAHALSFRSACCVWECAHACASEYGCPWRWV